ALAAHPRVRSHVRQPPQPGVPPMLSVVLAVLSCSPAAQRDKEPELAGFDYRAIHREAMSLVAEGKIDKAVELLDGLTVSKDTFGDAGRDQLKKESARYFATGGKPLGQEVVGYRRFGRRVYKIYALATWEKRTALLVYQVVRGAEDQWRRQTLRVSDKL